MLTVHLIAVGKLKESYLRDACAEYVKRLGSLYQLKLCEIDEVRLAAEPSGKEIARCLESEGEHILAKIPKRAFVIALCIEGRTMSSEAFSARLDEVAREHSDVALVIGSSHGLGEAVKQAAHLRLSLSPMTFPHQLARVMVLEQLYRAGMIAAGRRYHK